MNKQRTTSPGAIGRFFRTVVGIFLLVQVTFTYFRVNLGLIAYSIALALLLGLLYSFLHFLVLKYLSHISPWLGAILAIVPLFLMYALGSSQIPIFGMGRGQLAAALFLGVSLILAGWRGDSGCEVMSIPNSLFRDQTHLACLIFSPIDWVERKLQQK